MKSYGFLFAGATAASVIALDRLNEWEKATFRRESLVTSAVQRFLVKHGAPGASVGVSINGRVVLARGYGFADVENGIPCKAETVMRIASISKPITASIAGRLVEANKLEWDSSIYKYIPDFPKKKFNGKDVDITIRQLLSHTGGIRHYRKIYEEDDLASWDKLFSEYGKQNKDAEQLFRNVYKSTEEAVTMFKDDELISEPGTKFNYTTHGFTLVGLCLEKASGQKLDRLLKQVFNELGMSHTYLDNNERLIPNRAKFYRRNKKHVLVNVPEVDCSYKYASGGLLSTVEDILTFGHAMLFSYQSSSSTFLQSSTVHELWTTQVLPDSKYTLGWCVWPSEQVASEIKSKNQIWYHTGAGTGASSILLIKAHESAVTETNHPQGICVAVLVNMSGINACDLAREIVGIYEH